MDKRLLIGLAVLSIVIFATIVFVRQNYVTTGPINETEADNKIFPTVGEARSGIPGEFDRAPADAHNGNERSGSSVSSKNESKKSWPPKIEDRIWEFFAHSGNSNIISIDSVECTETNCEIEFAGTEVNPRHIGEFGDLYEAMLLEDWNIHQSGLGMREVAPNVRVYSISLSNIPIDQEEFRRAREAARQQQSDAEN